MAGFCMSGVEHSGSATGFANLLYQCREHRTLCGEDTCTE